MRLRGSQIRSFLFLFILGLSRITAHAQSTEFPPPVRCAANYSVTWADTPPFIHSNAHNDSVVKVNLHGLFYDLLMSAVMHCCADAVQLLWSLPQNTYHGVQKHLTDEHIALPVARSSSMMAGDSNIDTWDYVPVLESPSVMLLGDPSKSTLAVMSALAGCWPLGLIVLSCMGIAGILSWAIEHKSNSQDFPANFFIGQLEGVWWAFVSMTTVGYGDRTVRSFIGRVFGLGWITLGIVIMGIFTASITTAISGQMDISDEIKGSKVGVLHGSQEESIAYVKGAKPVGYKTAAKMADGLKKDEVDVLMVDTLFALHNWEELVELGMVHQGELVHDSVHGMLLQHNMAAGVRSCIARHLTQNRGDIFDLLTQQGKVGRFRARALSYSNLTTRKLLHSYMTLVYALFSVWAAMFLLGCVWEWIAHYQCQQHAAEEIQQTNTRSSSTKLVPTN